MLEKLAAEKDNDGPSTSTRLYKSQQGGWKQNKDEKEGKTSGNTGRLTSCSVTIEGTGDATPCDVTVADVLTSLETIGRSDDGSDDSVVSPKLAEAAVGQGIGRMKKIDPAKLQVALRKEDKPGVFSFSRTWTAPRVILHLSAGQLALVNMSFLVADDDLSCESMLIGLLVLKYLQVDTKTVLEANRAVPNGTDCSHIGNQTVPYGEGKVSRIMAARCNRVLTVNGEDIVGSGQTSEKPSRPRAN